jgi:RsiW-degrading membrane proteinase PrsW (M82 family)
VIGWFTVVAAVASAAAALLGVVLGLAGRKPSDLVLAGPALLELLLLAQGVIAIVSTVTGSGPTGNPVEWWAYLVGALIIPPAAILWALTERTRWSVVVVGIACFAVGVMVVRMWIIWTQQGV